MIISPRVQPRDRRQTRACSASRHSSDAVAHRPLSKKGLCVFGPKKSKPGPTPLQVLLCIEVVELTGPTPCKFSWGSWTTFVVLFSPGCKLQCWKNLAQAYPVGDISISKAICNANTQWRYRFCLWRKLERKSGAEKTIIKDRSVPPAHVEELRKDYFFRSRMFAFFRRWIITEEPYIFR